MKEASSPMGGGKGKRNDVEVPLTSVFRNSDLGQALMASNQAFTAGGMSHTLISVTERNVQQSRIKAAGSGVLQDPRNSNVAGLHRLVAALVIKEGGKALSQQQQQCTTIAVSAEDEGATMAASSSGSSTAAEVRISHLLRLLREEYCIGSKPLLDVLAEGLQRTNERLRQELSVSVLAPSSATYPAASSGSIPFGAFMELVDTYANGQPSVETRHACFTNFDTSRQRVVTLKYLRSLRGLSDAKLRRATNGAGTFPMLKALLDMFHQNEDLTTTLTKEQVVPMFDLDEGLLVEGFMEEILRQIAVNEYNATRGEIL